MTIKKILYSVAIFTLIIFGSLNDMIGAGAVLIMYAALALGFNKSENGCNVPCVCVFVVVLCTLLAGIINKAAMYDTCMTCVKLSAIGIPFLCDKEFAKNWILPNLYAAISIAAVVSLGLYAARFIAYHGYGDIRMQSVIGYANSSCVLFLVGVYLSVYYIKRGFIKRCIPMVIVCSVAAVLTFSRLGFVCFAFSLIMYVFFRYPKSRHYIITVLFAAAAVGVVFIISGYYKARLGSTMVNRIECWKDAFAVILKKPFGIGAGTWKTLQYSVQSADYSVFQIHNSILQIMLDGGIAAFIAFTVFVVYVLYRSKKDVLPLSVIALLLTHSFVDMDFYYICIPFTLGVVMRLEYEDKYFSKSFMWIYAVMCILLCLGVYMFDSADNNYVKKLSEDYRNAYTKGDIDGMYNLSAELVRVAPKQRESYESYKKTYMKGYRINNEFSDSAWKLYADGKDITLSGPPVEIDNKIMIPIKTVAERYGYEVKWDNVLQTMTIAKEGKVVNATKLKSKISFDENGKLTHNVGDVFVAGNRLMVKSDKLGNYLPISVRTDSVGMTIFLEGNEST